MQPAGVDRREAVRLRLLSIVMIVTAALLLNACAYISEPLPPFMNIPGRAENLAVVERGSNLIVHFTLPTLTTEGQALKQGLRLDLRIGPKPAGQFNVATWAAGATAVGGGTAANGVAEYKIPVADWIGREVTMAARVVGGSNGRDAGWTDPVSVTVIPPIEQPHGVHAEAVPEGVRLTWQGPATAFVILRRGPEEKDYATLGRTEKPEYVDTTAQFGQPYSYIVIATAPAAKGEAQSELSQEASITPVDTFPPAAPIGLRAVPSTSSIELAWDRNTEPGLTGYRVYRATGNGALERVGESEIASYSDHKIEAGKTYRYAVTAVKKNGRESAQSAVVEASTP
jgi:hypothetical protein